MTNHLDMINEALPRPGRLKVHMEISLPDEKGQVRRSRVSSRVPAVMRSHKFLLSLESRCSLRVPPNTRYASWCTQPISEEHKNTFFVPTLEGVRNLNSGRSKIGD